MTTTTTEQPACPRCHESDRVRLPEDFATQPKELGGRDQGTDGGGFCERCLCWVDTGPIPGGRPAPDFDVPLTPGKKRPTGAGNVSVIDIPSAKPAPQPSPEKLTVAQQHALDRLRLAPHTWVSLDKIVGMALVRRGIAEERDRPGGNRGQKDFRLPIAPGPYSVVGPRPITLMEQETLAAGGMIEPRWSIRNADGLEDSTWVEEWDARTECDRLNRRIASD